MLRRDGPPSFEALLAIRFLAGAADATLIFVGVSLIAVKKHVAGSQLRGDKRPGQPLWRDSGGIFARDISA